MRLRQIAEFTLLRRAVNNKRFLEGKEIFRMEGNRFKDLFLKHNSPWIYDNVINNRIRQGAEAVRRLIKYF